MTNDLENKLAKLHEDYKNKLPDKIAEIIKLWKNVIEKTTPENLALFRITVHKLNGSSNTYGYIEIGKAAARLEMLAASLEENPNQLKENAGLVDGLINELKRLILSETAI